MRSSLTEACRSLDKAARHLADNDIIDLARHRRLFDAGRHRHSGIRFQQSAAGQLVAGRPFMGEEGGEILPTGRTCSIRDGSSAPETRRPRQLFHAAGRHVLEGEPFALGRRHRSPSFRFLPESGSVRRRFRNIPPRCLSSGRLLRGSAPRRTEIAGYGSFAPRSTPRRRPLP